MLSLEEKTKKFIKIWLGITTLMVLCMVFIGGITRLTDSGLSMVEWKPLLGAIPPMNESEWSVVFEKYKQYPEYKIQNHRMNLEEFKFIFFWEYFHRLFGRLIGVVFILPYAFLFVRKKLNKSWNRKLLVALILGGSQGLLGWFMVKSGLVDRPDVSHFRLAAHFGLALIIMGYLLWLIFELMGKNIEKITPVFAGAKKLLAAFSATLILQITYGAFVAGLDAGVGFNTFPKMGKYWIPNGMFSSGNVLDTLINSNVGVQFVHRFIGWILLILAIALFAYAWKKLPHGKVRIGMMVVGGLTLAQFALGAATILSKVALPLASAHQVMACVLSAAVLKAVYDLTQVKKDSFQTDEIVNKTTA